MDTHPWLARCADFFSRFARRPPDQSTNDTLTQERGRRRAARSLRTRLPAHLRKDIGMDDG